MNDKPGWEAQYQIDTLRADLAKAQAESEAAAKRWDEENASLAAQLARTQARCAELARAIDLLLPHAEAWADGGGQHGPERRDVEAAKVIVHG